MLCAFLVPESPYFLVRKDLEAACKSVQRLHRHWSWLEVQAYVQAIKQASRHEEALTTSKESSFLDCFRGTNWRRTRIILYANGLSQMVGATFINNSPYFMVLAGLGATNTAMMIEVGIASSIFSSIVTLWAMARIGRRPIVLTGISLAAILFFIMGVAAAVPSQSSASLWCVAVTLQLVWLSIGPANGPAFAIAGEVSKPRLRAKSLAIGFFFNYLWSMAWNLAVPYLFNKGAGSADLGGLTGWIFFGTSLASLIIMWFELPETKDLSFEQIDRRFELRVHTRQFRQADVDPRGDIKGEFELGEVEQVEERILGV